MSIDLAFGVGAAIVAIGSCLMVAGLLWIRARHRAARDDANDTPET